MATQDPPPVVLPKDGVSRFKQIKPFLPFSKETWRKLVNEKKAPQPIVLSPRCTVYSNAQVHLWLSDPVNYHAEDSQKLSAQGDAQ